MEIVQKPDLRVLLTITCQAAHHAQTWSKASAKKLRALLLEHHGVRMSPRTWHRHLHAWVRAGALQIEHRHKKTRSGELELHSNITKVRPLAYGIIKSLAKAHELMRTFPPHRLWKAAMPNLAFSGTSTSVHRGISAPAAPKPLTAAPPHARNRVAAMLDRWRSRIQG